MYPILLEFGGFSLKTYGLFIVVAFFAALTFARRKSSAFGISDKFIYDLAFWSLLSGILGARIAYIALDPGYFIENPAEALKVWNGGLVFYGGLLFGFFGGMLVCRKYRVASWKRVADIMGPAMALAHAIGRVGCFFSGCCYGKETGSFFGVVFNNPGSFAPVGVRVLPTQLIESAGDLVIFFILNGKLKNKKYEGQVFALYIFYYAALRFGMEFLRGDYRGVVVMGLTSLQWVALLLFAGMSGFFIRRRIKNAG